VVALDYLFSPGYNGPNMIEGTARSSWLREAMLAAGFPTAPALGQRLGISGEAVLNWLHLGRPFWGKLEALVVALHVPLEEAVGALWGEHVGDPCPCGCGGKKTLPTHPNARKLVISLPCAKCGRIRVYERQAQHRRLCHPCGLYRAKPTTFTCVGYDDHGVTRHAKKCPRTKVFMPWEITQYTARQPTHWGKGIYCPRRWQRAFLDETSATFRCGYCSRGSIATVHLDQRLEREASERIRSRTHRSEVLRDVIFEFNPAFVNSRQKGLERGRLKRKRDGLSKTALLNRQRGHWVAAWAGPALPTTRVVSRCVFCTRLTITDRSKGNWHRSCLNNWYGTPQGRRYNSKNWMNKGPIPIPRPGPGRPAAPEALKRAFAWAIQHYLGGRSYRDIARDEGVAGPSIHEGVAEVMAALPDPALVAQRHRGIINLLLSSVQAT